MGAFRYSIDIDKVYNGAQLPRTINLHQKKKKKKACMKWCHLFFFFNGFTEDTSSGLFCKNILLVFS